MKPIKFSCQKSIALTPHEISEKIADVDQWSDFDGYWFLPGIVSATYENKTENNSTIITRKFELYPKNSFSKPFLWLISLVFRRAIAQHLSNMEIT